MDVREVLERMLDILHEKEWIKGSLYKINDRLYESGRILSASSWDNVQGVCLQGACNLALRDQVHWSDWQPLITQVNCAIINAAADSCPEKYQHWMTVMFQFNDFSATTREDVILAVKTAIAQLGES